MPESTRRSRAWWGELRRWPIPQPTNAIDPAQRVGSANGVVKPVKAHGRKEVGQITRTVLDGDHLAYTECSVDIAHDDPILGMTLQRDHDLAAVREIPGLAKVTQRRGSQPSLIQKD